MKVWLLGLGVGEAAAVLLHMHTWWAGPAASLMCVALIELTERAYADQNDGRTRA